MAGTKLNTIEIALPITPIESHKGNFLYRLRIKESVDRNQTSFLFFAVIRYRESKEKEHLSDALLGEISQ